jgi:hypothetical protein
MLQRRIWLLIKFWKGLAINIINNSQQWKDLIHFFCLFFIYFLIHDEGISFGGINKCTLIRIKSTTKKSELNDGCRFDILNFPRVFYLILKCREINPLNLKLPARNLSTLLPYSGSARLLQLRLYAWVAWLERGYLEFAGIHRIITDLCKYNILSVKFVRLFLIFQNA